MKTRPSVERGRSAIALLVILASFTPQASSRTLRGAPPPSEDSSDSLSNVPAIDASFLASTNDIGSTDHSDAPATSNEGGGDTSDNDDDPSLLQGERNGAAAGGGAPLQANENEVDSMSSSTGTGSTEALASGTEGSIDDEEAMRKFTAELEHPAEANPSDDASKAPHLDSQSEAIVFQAQEEDSKSSSDDEMEVKRLEQRFTEVHQHTQKFRNSLREALVKDQALEGQLHGARGVISTQQNRLLKLQKKAEDISTALTAEWSSERELKWRLSNATAKIQSKEHELDEVHHELETMAGKLNTEIGLVNAAEVAKKQEAELFRTEQKQLKDSQQLEAKLNRRAKSANSKNSNLERKVYADHQEIQKTNQVAVLLQRHVAQLQAELAKARAEKEQKDTALKASAMQRGQLEGKVVSEMDAIKTLRNKLHEAGATTKLRQGILTQELGMHSARYESEKEWEQDLKQHVTMLHNGARLAIQNLTQQLEMVTSKDNYLVKEKDAMEHELAKTIRQKKKLAKEVEMLRQRVARGDSARESVEKKAKEMSKQLAQVQTVNRQLEGTVPQLLEEARMAREAKDAENAMRSQAQQAIANMSKNAVTSELSQLKLLVANTETPGTVASATKTLTPEVTKMLTSEDLKGVGDMANQLDGDLRETLKMQTPTAADALVGVSLDEDTQPKSTDAPASSDALTEASTSTDSSADASES